MSQAYRLPFLGYVAIWKQAGTASALSSIAQINIPDVSGIPLNPDNNQLPGVVNATSYPSLRVKGMKTPSVVLKACYKPSWVSANLFNSLINVGTDNKSDRFSIGFKDDAGAIRIWDWARCERLQLQQSVMGGPIMVEMDFKCRYGDNEAPYGGTDPATGSAYGAAPVYVTPSGADAGELYGDFDTTFTGLGSVRSYTLTLMRGQAYVNYFQSTSNRNPSEIATTMFSGVLSVDQDPGGTAITDTGSATIQIGATGVGGSVLASMSLVRDEKVYPFDVSLGNMSTRYSIVNLSTGANPCAFTAP